MLFIQAHCDWMERHAKWDCFTWRCIETNKPILFNLIERIVEGLPYEFAKDTEDGKTIKVAYMYCSGCNPIWDKSGIDKPLHFSELVEVRMPFEK